MSEYRDALASAKEQVARLEAIARERGLLDSGRGRSHRGRNFALGAVCVLAASACLFDAIRSTRQKLAGERTVPSTMVVPRPLPPLPERDLEWYEPDRSWNPNRGPQEVNAGSLHLVVGLLWQRGERTNALYLGAFDVATTKKVWLAGPFESEWTSERQKRFSFIVDGEKVVLADSAGALRVLSARSGELLSKREMPLGTTGICRTITGPPKLMVGFGAHDEANTAAVLFPWELDHIKPYYVDPERGSLTPAPNAPPTGTWCASNDDGRNWKSGHRVVTWQSDPNRIDGALDNTTDGRWTYGFTMIQDTYGESAMGADSFFHGWYTGSHQLVGLDLLDGKPKFTVTVDRPEGAQLHLLKFIAPDRLYALYDDEMLVFDTNGNRIGKLSANR